MTDTKVLQRELELVKKQLAFETQRREDIMRVFTQEKAVSRVPEEHVAALNRREDELMRLRSEISEMKHFLQLGVTEAQRLARLAEELRVNGAAMVSNEQSLTDDIKRLRDTQKTIEIEIETSKGALSRQRDAKVDVEQTLERTIMGAKDVLDEAEGKNREIARIKGSIEELLATVRAMERIDLGAHSLGAATRRALHQLNKLQSAVSSGTAASSSSEVVAVAGSLDDDYDSAEDAEPSANTQVVCNSAKTNLSKCETLLAAIHSSLSRFEGDEKHRLLASRRQQADLLEQMRSELQDLKLRSQHHLQSMQLELQHREPLLARYTEVRAAALSRNIETLNSDKRHGMVPVPLEKQFNLIEFLQRENNDLLQVQRDLEARQKHLEEKYQKRETDYKAIRELRHTYRDLDAKKTLLSIDLRGAEEENKRLKMMCWDAETITKLKMKSSSVAGQSPARARSPHVSVADTSSSSAKRPPWRATPQI